MKRFSPIACAAFFLGSALLPAAAQTAPTVNKTWVSSTGTDSGSCQLVSPCKTFAYAISETNAGGEIDVKDSGAYGPIVVSKAISIIADGVLASVGLGSEGAGITVSAGPGDNVVLRGLSVNVHNTFNGLNAINITSGKSTVIDHCVIAGSFNGVFINLSGFVMITNSLITSNIYGVEQISGNVYIGSNVVTTNNYGLYGTVRSYNSNQINGNSICDTCQATVLSVSNE